MITSKIIALYLLLSCSFIITTKTAHSQNLVKNEINKTEQYQCLPCGSDCDKQVYNKAGKCSQCGMELVKSSTINFKTIQPSEICNYIKQHPNVILLDVRTKEEFEGKADPNFGTLVNALNIPVQQLEERLSEISNLKNKEIIVFCSHSRRSPRASYILTTNGFTNVTNMAGGMSMMNDKECKK